MVKILLLPRYDRLGASSRMRSYQYVPWLEKEGFEVAVSPLFSDEYVLGLQQGRKSLRAALNAYGRRVKALLSSRCYDLLMIEKECFPWLPASIERYLMASDIPYIIDYDDAVFHYYDKHGSLLVRSILGHKHKDIIRSAALVTVGNEYLAGYAQGARAKWVEIVPTVVDLDHYISRVWSADSSSRRPRIGWIGQRSTAKYLDTLIPVMQRLSDEGIARFVAIGIDAAAVGLPMESVAWSVETEVVEIQSLDIGLMPLMDNPFERGKCGYKLIQYMACGIPVVASPVGVNRQLVEHGVNGFLASTREEWERSLRTLIGDPVLRQRMGRAGRRKVEKEYAIQVTGSRMAHLLRTVISKSSRG